MPYLSHISRGSIVRILGLITGSKQGVSTIPCVVCNRPSLAWPSRADSNFPIFFPTGDGVLSGAILPFHILTLLIQNLLVHGLE